MLVLFALQSVKARPQSWLVGVLAGGMAVLLTLGASLMSSIYDGTQRSMIESGAGHLQIYNSHSPEPPQMFIGFSGVPELVPLPDYPSTEELLRGVEGVQEVVPIEAGLASVFRGNYLDEKLAAARAVTREPASEERQARLERIGADLARTFQHMAGDASRRAEVFASDAELLEDERALEEATSEAFWARFPAEPLPALEFLENRVAKQAGEGDASTLDYLGTDLPQFVRAFPRFELVSGEMPPEGSRGILLGQGAYEQYFKHPIAARLDQLKRELDRGRTLAGDERLRTLVERNLAELPDLVSRLDVERATALQAVLARSLGREAELEALLAEFLEVGDGNFGERYQLFYGEMRPHLPLYRVQPGDTLNLRQVLERGPHVEVRVWGTFRFQGFGGDTSLVNTVSLVDLVTARRLAERPTRADLEEAQQLRTSMGFSGAPEELSPTSFGLPTIVDEEAVLTPSEAPVLERVEPSAHFTPDELKGDSVLQAALVLSPAAAPERVAERIRELARERQLPLTVATWEEVGGHISGALGMARLLLLVLAVLLGFFVLLVSAGTLLLLARERVGEVGVLRAVGMQRRQVFFCLLLEGMLLGGVGGLVGCGLGAVLVRWGAGDGLPIHSETLQFFLGGAVLYLHVGAWQVLGVVLGVMGVMGGAVLVPAWRGSAVTPIVAMRQKED
jgi:ABC-type lipoprotein release transport system permease subunit